MNVKIDGANLVINYFDLLGNLTREDQIAVADALSCQDDVIAFVVQQILTGWTDQSSSGGRVCGFSQWQRGIDLAITEISKASGEIAKKEIEKLRGELVALTKERNDLNHKLYAPAHIRSECDICAVRS